MGLSSFGWIETLVLNFLPIRSFLGEYLQSIGVTTLASRDIYGSLTFLSIVFIIFTAASAVPLL